jgi:excisionase family DNA binding protein
MTRRKPNSEQRDTSNSQQRVVTARRSPAGDSLCLTVSVEQAGRILGISRGAAYTHARDGSIPTIKLGKRLLVPKAALEKLLACG